jgi:hypothetical protein
MGKQNVEGAVRVCPEGLPPEPLDKLTALTAEVGQGPEPAEGPGEGESATAADRKAIRRLLAARCLGECTRLS